MSPGWTFAALLGVALYVAVTEASRRGADAEGWKERALAAEAVNADFRRERRMQTRPWPCVVDQPEPAALAPAPEPLALEAAGEAFADSVIDLPPDAAHTVTMTLPVIPEPIDPTKVPAEQRRFLPPLPLLWPGETKENVRVN